MASKPKKLEEKLLGLLNKAHSQLQQWEAARSKALAQLSSIANLAEQLETLQRCEGGRKMGVLGGYPLVAPLLQARIVESMERARGYAWRERKALVEVTNRLRRFSREGQAAFEETVGLKGLEATCQRTAESFSLAEYASWLKQLYCAYQHEVEEKLSALEALQYTSESTGHVCSVWERDVAGVEETLEYLNYTIGQHTLASN